MDFVPTSPPDAGQQSNVRTSIRLAEAYLSNRAAPAREPLDRALRVALALVATVVFNTFFFLLGAALGGAAVAPIAATVGFPFALGLGLWLSAITRIAAQWERVVVLRLGRFHSVKGPEVSMRLSVIGSVLGLLLVTLGCGPASITLSISNYSQACTENSDCVAASFADVCAGCQCPNGAIAVSSKAKYDADYKAAVAACGRRSTIVCQIVCLGTEPKCVANKCQL